MDIDAYIDINKLPEEGRNELQQFYDYLLYKYLIKNDQKHNNKSSDFKEFANKHLISIPGDFKFIREELHER